MAAEKSGQPFKLFLKVHKIGCELGREASRPKSEINPEDKGPWMKIIGRLEVDTVTDVVCDVCQCLLTRSAGQRVWNTRRGA